MEKKFQLSYNTVGEEWNHKSMRIMLFLNVLSVDGYITNWVVPVARGVPIFQLCIEFNLSS